ncbi:MAG: MoaD/ThiS family protein [Candidatus Methanomethylicia archaeon]
MGTSCKHLIVVKFMAILKRIALKPVIMFDIDEIKLKDLIKIIILINNQEFNRRLIINGLLSSDVLVFVNGVEINVLSGLNTVLKRGDEVVFLPTVHGGG